MDELSRLKKQVKILTICVATLVVAMVIVLTMLPSKLTSESWPDLTVGKLTARQIFVVGPDGRRKVVLFADEGGGTVALTNGNEKSESEVLLTAAPNLALIRIDGEGKTKPLILTNTTIQMGEDDQPSFRVLASEAGGPSLLLQDHNGYAAKIGRTALLSNDGTQTFTSAATLVGSSKNAVSQWSLLKSVTTKTK